MKKLLFSICLLAIISVPAFSHSGTMTDSAGTDVTSWSGVNYEHQDAPEWKGVATFIFKNTMEVAWTDFHFSISAPGGGVFFEENAVETKMIDFLAGTDYDSQDYSIVYDQFELIGGINRPTEVNFYFDQAPVQPGEYVQFDLYTDNTTYSNEFFTITATPTPEPVTVALLGLGGLVLIRRKK